MKFAEFVITLELKIFGKNVEHKKADGRPNYIHTFFKSVQNIIDYDQRNYLVNCPPRVGKSRYMGIYLIAYAFAINSSCKFIYIHIEENLAKTQVAQLKMILESEHYKKITKTRFNSSIKGWRKIETEKGGGILSTLSILSNVTGLGAGQFDQDKFSGAIIFDEPHQANDYTHPARIREVVDRFFSNVITRRQTERVPFIIIGHRISNYDLFAKLLTPDNVRAFNWVHIKIKAITDKISVSPSIFSLEYLKSVENRTPEIFAAQYMQEPIHRTDVIFNVELIKTNLIENFRNVSRPKRDIIISVDPNGNSKTSPDTTAIVSLSVFYDDDKKSKAPNLEVESIHDQKEPNLTAITAKIAGTIMKYGDRVLRVYIESHTFGHALYDSITEMADMGHLQIPKSAIIPTKRILNKRLFMLRVSFYVNAHLYLRRNEINRGVKYLGLLEELETITVDNERTKDDIADALSEIFHQVYEKKTVPLFRTVDERDRSEYRNRLRKIFT